MKIFKFILAVCLPGLVSAQVVSPQLQDTVPTRQSMMLRGQNPPSVQSFIVPAVFVTYGLISLGNNAVRRLDYSTKAEITEDHPLFAHHLDNYMQFAPAAAVFGLDLLGIKGKHKASDQLGLYVLSEAIMGISTGGVKRMAKRLRPDGSNNYSFPSGHTANAFAAAEFLNQEYRDVSPWIGYAGYTVATATGMLRLYNNKHWVSDVVAGAGFGIASTKIAYLLYPHLKKLVFGKQTMHYSMVPTYQQKAAGIAFNATF